MVTVSGVKKTIFDRLHAQLEKISQQINRMTFFKMLVCLDSLLATCKNHIRFFFVILLLENYIEPEVLEYK